MVRTLEAKSQVRNAVVAVATQADAKTLKSQIEAVLKELDASDKTPITEVVDETLVGGFVATYDYKEHDASYKKSLVTLYESIVK